MIEDIDVLAKELDCENCDHFYTCDNNWSEDNLRQCALEKLNRDIGKCIHNDKDNQCEILLCQCEPQCPFTSTDKNIVAIVKDIIAMGNEEPTCKYCKKDFNYVDVDVIDGNDIEIIFSVNGGYERDTNAYWGGDEYVDDLIESLDIPTDIKVWYDLDHEDLCGTIYVQKA